MINYCPENFDPLKKIQRIYIEKSELKRPAIQLLKKKAPSLLPHLQDIEIIDNFFNYYQKYRHTFKRSHLFLVKNRGHFHKPCPGTKNHVCCLYQVLDIANNCYYDCRYCILQSYFPVRSPVIYTNIEKIEKELKEWTSPTGGARFGTGQFTDSLLMEPLYPQAEKLISIFNRFPRYYLELKTKSVFINHILPHRDKNIILSWSLNTSHVIRQWEQNTTSLSRRLQAARTASLAGFPLSFHFDPIITYPRWQNDYEGVLEELFRKIDSRNILYISLGCLRYSPQLKKTLLERGVECSFLFEPFYRGKDGKMRYFSLERRKVYQFFLQKIQKLAPHVLVYFCMERPEIWRHCLEPMDTKKLGYRLLQRTEEFFQRR